MPLEGQYFDGRMEVDKEEASKEGGHAGGKKKSS